MRSYALRLSNKVLIVTTETAQGVGDGVFDMVGWEEEEEEELMYECVSVFL